MPDVDGTLVEISYALDKLGAEGIQLMTSYSERYPGHPDFAPVMAEPNRRKALVFVHPLAPVCCAPSLAWIQPALFEFTQDTNRRLQPSVHRNARAVPGRTLHLLPLWRRRSGSRWARRSVGI